MTNDALVPIYVQSPRKLLVGRSVSGIPNPVYLSALLQNNMKLYWRENEHATISRARTAGY